MPFPKARFENEKRLCPNLSSFILFGRIIRGRKLDKTTLHRWFKGAVDKSDYDSADVESLMEHLLRLTMA
jgi:hypothetical protein